jgi:hypothetical protein
VQVRGVQAWIAIRIGLCNNFIDTTSRASTTRKCWRGHTDGWQWHRRLARGIRSKLSKEGGQEVSEVPEGVEK